MKNLLSGNSILKYATLVTVIFVSSTNIKATDDTTTFSRGYEDPRLRKLASQLVNYSIELKEGERILLRVDNEGSVPLATAIIDEVYKAGGIPFVDITNEQIKRALYLGATPEQFQLMFTWDSLKFSLMNAWIMIDGDGNSSEFADVPVEKFSSEAKYYREPVRKVTESKVRWCYIRTPSPGMAQSAEMSTEAFTDFYFKVCNLDYSKMTKAMEPLEELMKTTDSVHIIGPGTDLSFSIKDIPDVPCVGKLNVPDGEICTAPVKNSVNGIWTINLPADYKGTRFRDIQLEFKDGRIIKASANSSDKLNNILDVDEGARYLGEFALGLNPYIKAPIGFILFDEKINMSFHLAIGNSLPDADNGNHSAIHWDIVCIQSPEYGGGEIWFDGKLIRKDGLFVPPELQGLNPENLK